MGRTRGLHGHSIKPNIGLVSILQWLSRSPHMRKVLAGNRVSLFLRFTFPFKKLKRGAEGVAVVGSLKFSLAQETWEEFLAS